MQTETGKKSWSTEQKRTPEAKLEIERTKSYCDKMWAQSDFKRWGIGNWNGVEIENWISNLETEWGAGGTKCGFRHLPSNSEKLDFPLRWLLIHNCCRITGKGMGCKKMDIIGMLFCPLSFFKILCLRALGIIFSIYLRWGIQRDLSQKLLYNFASVGRFYLEMLG